MCLWTNITRKGSDYMHNYHKQIKELEKHFFNDCHINEWRRITHDFRPDSIPGVIRKLQDKFVDLMYIPKPLSDKQQKAVIRQMKKICRKITCYYNIIRIKYFIAEIKQC